jgi:hypothetical protein
MPTGTASSSRQEIDMPYAKMIAQVVATVLAALVPYLAVGGLDASAWVNVAIIGVGALAVFAAPNVPGAPVTKLVLSALSAVLVLLASVITGGITLDEVLQLVLAALGALGVYSLRDPAQMVGPGSPRPHGLV